MLDSDPVRAETTSFRADTWLALMDRSTTPAQSLTSARQLFRVIEGIEEAQPVGVTELSRALDIPTSSVQVYVNTLYENGYIVKVGSKYRLALRFFRHGMNALRTFEIYPAAKPKVYELAEETGELVAAFVEERGQAVYAVAAAGERAIRTDLNIGAHTDLHCTAGGKAMLANLPREDADAIIETRGLPAYTDSTITDVDDLEAELEEIRANGVAFNEEESIPNMNAVAAPVISGGTVLGSISISGPSTRFHGSLFEDELAGRVKSTANEIELNLEYDETVY